MDHRNSHTTQAQADPNDNAFVPDPDPECPACNGFLASLELWPLQSELNEAKIEEAKKAKAAECEAATRQAVMNAANTAKPPSSSDAEKKIKFAQRQTKTLQASNADLEAELAKLKTELTETLKNNEKLKSDCGNVEFLSKGLKVQADKAVANAEKKTSDLEKELTETKEQLRRSQEEVSLSWKRTQHHADEATKLKSEAEKRDKLQKDLDSDNDGLRTQNKDLESRLAAAEKRAEVSEEKLRDLRGMYNLQDKTCKDLSETIEQLTKERDEARSKALETDQLKASVADLEEKTKKLREHLTAQTEATKEMRVRYADRMNAWLKNVPEIDEPEFDVEVQPKPTDR